jgi:filamentous hemagglutinin family protein
MKFKSKIFPFAVALFFAGNNFSSANPTGLTVSQGSASLQTSGSQLNITTSAAVVLNWQSFNIAAGQTTTFIQPSSSSVALNIIGGASPSQIFGSLNANGTVILANANGFYFGPDSMIKVGGSFIATTAPLEPDFGLDSPWQFTGLPPLASIVNYGQIEVGSGQSLFLIAENVQNNGGLIAPGGDVGLYAGQSVLVSERPDGRGLSATVQIPSGSIDNLGQITADAGTIALQAQVVNQDGIIQADSVQNQNGVIELVASDQLSLGANSQILARGDSSTGGSPGGSVTLQSGNSFSDSTGSQISVTGGSQGGNGGNVEVSAPNILSLNSSMDASAQSGWNGGTFFLDPVNITLGTSTANGAINVNSAFVNFSQIDLQASGNITLNAGTTWNLSASTGVSSGALTLQAGGNIIFGNGSKITDANSWSVTLDAGYNLANNTINSGVGNIYLNGSSSGTQSGTIQLSAGDINLYAGQNILVGSGSVFTTGGGSIFANALAGDINAGTANGGYKFTVVGSTVGSTLGGISTGAGGNVTLIAGDNISSTPTVSANQAPGASGAYGPEPGNVTLIAGNQILGNYTIANGVGTILTGVQVQSTQAGILQNPGANPTTYASTLGALETEVTQTQNPTADVGSSTSPVNLSLINGSWNVWAADSIYIGEVRNPNGTFNPNSLTGPPGEYAGNTDDSTVPTSTSFLFNYAPDAAANFWAANAIALVGANLPRVNGQNQSMPPIYAPILTLNAGAGGVTVDNSIILFPSSEGALQITTRAGGDLVGAVSGTTLTGITMSDSGLPGWATFAQGQASTPLYLNNPNPVVLNISGSIESFGLTVPTFAQISVTGNTYNFGFLGQNLSSSQTTFINVTGDITYRGDLTSETLSDPITSTLFSSIVAGDPALASSLTYDATTGTLTFIGVMTDDTSLLNPTDANGQPVAFTSAQLASWQSAISGLYTGSQTATLGDQGLAVAGPGNFNISADNIDLGISGGITVLEPDAPLAAISPDGADINVTTLGNLEMTSSEIANEGYLGGINLNVGGTLDVGGEFTTFGDPNAPKGIFTTSSGNISVIATGDVNVDSSRIAAYNGGNVTVESQNGDVNAGAGGAGIVSMNSLEFDPTTGQLTSIAASIPGSGILATTVPGSDVALGNILVEAPNGSINASAGGILQLSFGEGPGGNVSGPAQIHDFFKQFIRHKISLAQLKQDLEASDSGGSQSGGSAGGATLEVLAGYELEDGSGNPVYADDLTAGTPVLISANRNIDATDSGIIGSNIKLQASGDITGLVIGSASVAINSQENVDVTAFSGGNVDISASGDVSGTIISGGTADVSGDAIDASVVANSISSSGDTSAASLGVPQSNVTENNAQTADDSETAVAKTDIQGDDDDLKKKGKGISLAAKVSRVTVLLPQKN